MKTVEVIVEHAGKNLVMKNLIPVKRDICHVVILMRLTQL